MPLNDLLAFVTYSLLSPPADNKLILIDHKNICDVSRCSSCGLRWGIRRCGLLLDDWLNLELGFHWLRHLLLTIHVKGVWRQIQSPFVFLDDMFLEMRSHLNCTAGSDMVGNFFNLF